MESALNLLWELSNPFKCLFTNSGPTSSQNQRLKPLPDLPLEIWLEIFQFATYVHQHATIVPLDPFSMKRVSTNVLGINTPTFSTRTKLSLVLVCRSWHQIAVQMLYEHMVIRSPARANAILAVLRSSTQRSEYDEREPGRIQASSGYGMWTRHIEIFTHARGAHDIRYLQSIFHIFQACPNLRTLSGTWSHPLPVEFLNAISTLYGPSLEALYWGELTIFPTITAPEFIGSFQSLRVLDLRNYVGNELAVGSEIGRRILLPKMQHLIISTLPRSVAVATVLSLPALRNLTIKTMGIKTDTLDLLLAFLKVHGRSLTSIDLPSPSVDSDPDPDTAAFRRSASHLNPDIFLRPGLCPNLDTFTFPTTSPPLSSHVHYSLRRIGLRGVRAESLYPDKMPSDKGSGTKGHLFSFTPDKYPNLEVVKTVGFLVDADTDSLIKDVFIWWVEKFEKLGIDFLDGESVLWAYVDSPSYEPKGRSARTSVVSSHPTTLAKGGSSGKKVDLLGNLS